MNDDTSLRSSSEKNDTSSVVVAIRSDADGHWVEWTRGTELGRLGPYVEAEVAEIVREAKERELTENDIRIDDADARRGGPI